MKKLKTTLLTLALTALVSAAGWVFNWFVALGNQADATERDFRLDKAVKDEVLKNMDAKLSTIKEYQERSLCLQGEKSRCH